MRGCQATERKNLRTELVSKLEKQGISTDGSIIDYDGTDPLPLDVVVDPKLGTVSITASQNPTNASALFGKYRSILNSCSLQGVSYIGLKVLSHPMDH